MHCSSVEIRKGYMLMCRNAKRVHGKQKVGNPCSKSQYKFVDVYCQCPTMTALVFSFGAKAFNDTELCHVCLAGRNTIAFSTGETNKNVTVNFLKTHLAYGNFTSLFSSLCSTVASKIYNFLKTKHTIHIHAAAVRRRAVKNVAHRSKTRQVKHPKWLQLLESRFECLLLFQTVKNRTQRIRRAKEVRFKLTSCCHY